MRFPFRRKKPTIELFRGYNRLWYFHLKARNNKVTGVSQGYKQKRYAKEAIRRDYPDLEVREV